MFSRGVTRNHLASVFLVLTLAGGGPAFAQQQVCTNLPRYGWVSAEEIEARLKSAGYQLLRLRITNEACYAALVVNTIGQMMELRIHPATNEVLPPDEISTSAIRR